MIVRSDFAAYIDAFNQSDFDGFGRFYAENMSFEGRGRYFISRAAVLDFYREVKRRMIETLTVKTLIVAEDRIAAELETYLEALQDWPDFVSQPVTKGDIIRVESFVFYDVVDGHFTRIRSARYRKLQ